MKIVIIESPYQGGKPENVEYARKALKDSLERGEAPFASHLLYTQVWDDANPEQRKMGIDAGHEFIGAADIMAVYYDLGRTEGMRKGIERASANDTIRIEFRSLETSNYDPRALSATSNEGE